MLPKELTKPVLQVKLADVVPVKSTETPLKVVFELAGTVHLIRAQVPEVTVRAPVFGTETPSDLVAFTALQLAVIVAGEYPSLQLKD